jgi:hypothetical protein
MFDAAGIEAGFVNMNDYVTLPESKIEVTIPYGAQAGVYAATLFVREGDCEKTYVVTIAIESSPVVVFTSETELFVKEGEEFILLVETIGATGYQWYFEGLPIAGATQCFYSDIFNDSKEGTYTVNITNECGINSVDFKVQSALHVPDIALENYKLTVYPNPVIRGNLLTLQLEVPENENQEAVAQILDVTGKEISTYNITRSITEIKLNIAEGAYLIRVNTKSGKELLTKIIVQQ